MKKISENTYYSVFLAINLLTENFVQVLKTILTEVKSIMLTNDDVNIIPPFNDPLLWMWEEATDTNIPFYLALC